MANQDFEEIYNAYREQQSEQQTKLETEQGQAVEGKESITAVRKNDDGDLIAFKTDTGRELDYITALEEAKAGKLVHVEVFHKYGRDIIRSEPDGIKKNNLDHLPLF